MWQDGSILILSIGSCNLMRLLKYNILYNSSSWPSHSKGEKVDRYQICPSLLNLFLFFGVILEGILLNTDER